MNASSTIAMRLGKLIQPAVLQMAAAGPFAVNRGPVRGSPDVFAITLTLHDSASAQATPQARMVTTYQYSVRAFNSAGASVWVGPVLATTAR